MSLRGSPLHGLLITALVVALIAIAQPAGQLPAGSAAAGAKLFSGTMRFRNGGPACASCHSAAGIPFPNGGTLGPDLTTASVRFGPEAMQMFVSTLFFPTMIPVFQGRLLTPAEQSDLLAFFAQSSGSGAAPPDIGWIFTTAGVLGAAVLFVITALTWRRRLRSIRHPLVASTIGVPRP